MRKAQRSLGRFIKKSRETAGFETIGKLGARTGLNTATLWRIERGISLPKPATLKKISPAIRVPLEVLMAKAGYIELERYRGKEEKVPYGEDVLNLGELAVDDRDKVRSYFEFLKYLSGRN